MALPDDIEQRVEGLARRQLEFYQLEGWQFGWDKARRRLGACWFDKRLVTISAVYMRENKETNLEQVLDTLLHEIAHALAWTHHRERTHGKHWRHFCKQLGCSTRATVVAEQVCSSPPKYAMRLKTTGEIITTYLRRPKCMRYVHKLMLRNQPDTLGKLEIVPFN